MRLLINADDFGISESVNSAIDYCFKKNLIQRTTIMVNMDSSDSAVILAKGHGYADKVGLHLNLVEGTPLTEPIKNTIFCTNGVFNGQALKKQANRFFLNKKTQIAVSGELRAQIEKYIEYGFILRHVDSHEHSHTNPSVFKLLYPLLKEYEFLTIRLSKNIPRSQHLIKNLYKTLFNRIVLSFNKKQQPLKSTINYFGTQEDAETFMTNQAKGNESIEIEIHPCIDEYGELVELLHGANIAEWLNVIKKKGFSLNMEEINAVYDNSANL